MAQFLLVHGSCHGAWCWRDVLPILNNLGHTARAIDLPGRGDCIPDLSKVTLDSFAVEIVKNLSQPTIIVGHSMAGYAITAAAELDPRWISALVYLCAYVPQTGRSLAQMRRAGPSQPLATAIRVAPDRLSFDFQPSMIADKFYHDCPAESVRFAATHLVPEAVAPQETPLTVTARSQSLPRYYIRCSEDRAIPPDYQTTMAKGLPLTSLATSHSPFFSAPKALAERLAEIAATP